MVVFGAKKRFRQNRVFHHHLSFFGRDPQAISKTAFLGKCKQKDGFMSFKSNHLCFILLASYFVLLSCEEYEDEFFDDELVDTRASVIGIYQAEDRTYQKNCQKRSNNKGYTGSGYMDYGGNGSLVEWNNVRAPSKGT